MLRSAIKKVRRRLRNDQWARKGKWQLDELLEEYLPRRGFFIEAGANDGCVQSNTYFLEACRGWTGILIEPDPELCSQCIKNRPKAKVICAALVSLEHASDSIELTVVEKDRSMSFTSTAAAPAKAIALAACASRTVSVPAKALSQILGECGIMQVDFLSLDVEGAELNVLKGIDFDRHRIRWLLTECLTDTSFEEVSAFLSSRYILQGKLTPRDVLFKLRGS